MGRLGIGVSIGYNYHEEDMVRTILVFVGLKKRFGDGVVQFDVVGSVKVRSDGVEQLLELVLGQRLGGVVRVQGSEKIVDLGEGEGKKVRKRTKVGEMES